MKIYWAAIIFMNYIGEGGLKGWVRDVREEAPNFFSFHHATVHRPVFSERNPKNCWMTSSHPRTGKTTMLKWTGKAETHTSKALSFLSHSGEKGLCLTYSLRLRNIFTEFTCSALNSLSFTLQVECAFSKGSIPDIFSLEWITQQCFL